MAFQAKSRTGRTLRCGSNPPLIGFEVHKARPVILAGVFVPNIEVLQPYRAARSRPVLPLLSLLFEIWVRAEVFFPLYGRMIALGRWFRCRSQVSHGCEMIRTTLLRFFRPGRGRRSTVIRPSRAASRRVICANFLHTPARAAISARLRSQAPLAWISSPTMRRTASSPTVY